MAFFDIKASKGETINVGLFQNPADFAAYTEKAAKVSPFFERSSDFYGATPTQTLERLHKGAPQRVATVDRVLDKVENAVDFCSARYVMRAAVAGGVPCVPSALAGVPTAMRARRRVVDDMGPLAVFIDMGLSASVKDHTIARRGAAALALVRLLSATRPVELWTFTAQTVDHRSDTPSNAISAIRLETAPLDLARAAWLLCAPEAFRRAGFASSSALAGLPKNFDVNWLFDDHKRHNSALPSLLAKAFGDSDRLVIPALFTGGETQFNDDATAIAWVQSMIEQHSGLLEAA